MPVTVEARGICAHERLADVYVTTAHLHDEPDDLAGFTSRMFDVPYAAVVTLSELRTALDRTGYATRGWWGAEGEPDNALALGAVIDRFITMLALGALDRLASSSLIRGWPHPAFFEEMAYRRRHDVETMGPIKATTAMDIAARLSSPEGPVDDALGAALLQLQEYEVPLSASPKLRNGIQLRQLKELVRSPKSLVLLPLAGEVAGCGNRRDPWCRLGAGSNGCWNSLRCVPNPGERALGRGPSLRRAQTPRRGSTSKTAIDRASAPSFAQTRAGLGNRGEGTAPGS